MKHKGFTPGPWRVWIEKAEDGHITTLEVCETKDRGRHKHFANIAHSDWWPEAEANANLIAEAPNLLAKNTKLLDVLIKLWDLELPCYATLHSDINECNDEQLCDSCKALKIIHDTLEAEGYKF